MTKGMVETKEGAKYKLVKPEEAGLVPCNGEAHSNPYIDNCMVCAPRWGTMMSYKPIPLAACTKGAAVSYNSAELDAFYAAEKAGEVKMVMVTEKTRATTTSFFAWVLA